MLKRVMRPVSFFLVFSFVLLSFNVPTTQAKMIGTSAVIAGQQDTAHRAQVASFLARDDVKQIMTQQGVDPVEAQNRINSLSSEELSKVASAMDQLPAGGSAVGAIVGAAVLVFVILLITDILGFTHVFSFVNPQR